MTSPLTINDLNIVQFEINALEWRKNEGNIF